MKFKYEIEEEEDPKFYKGTHWLTLKFYKRTRWSTLEIIRGSYTRDIASEQWRTTRESSNQYLPERNFTDPFDPTEQELTMFELIYGTDSKDEYLKWMNAVIEFRKQQEHINEKQS